MDDWNLDEDSFSNFSLMPIFLHKEWQTMLGFTFSVGDTTQVVYN